MHAIGTVQFLANQSVTWAATCGSITTSGVFTAPAASAIIAPATSVTCTIKGTSTANSSNTATATATINVVNYTTRKGSNDGTGRQLNELVLTPASVSSGKFGQLWPAPVGLDGGIWGQPLYMNGITMGDGKAHNVLFVTTDHDSVYALDADSGTRLWKTSFLAPGVMPVAGASLGISSQTGILSTPVIDPVRKMIYVVAETSENNSFPHKLHALSLINGAESPAGPQLITHPNLLPSKKFQRPGLLLANGKVYVGFGAIKDLSENNKPYHGLLFAFDAVTLEEQKPVFDVAPTGSEGGIWMSGASPLADSSGNIYISTGNGTVSTNNYGESIVKLSPTLQPLDRFTPFDWQNLDGHDKDLGSGSMILVPDQNGPYPHEVIACGKPTPIYVLNRDRLGDRGASSDNILQRLDKQLSQNAGGRDPGEPCYNSPAMWLQNVYFAANNDVLKMFVLNADTGMLSPTPVSKGTFIYQWPGSDPVVSSNPSNTNGIVWTLDYLAGTLHASDAADVSKELYRSPSLGTGIRWVPPTVVNGHVYLGISNRVYSFGMIP
jgi:outer membrane protein assembly factor BamB